MLEQKISVVNDFIYVVSNGIIGLLISDIINIIPEIYVLSCILILFVYGIVYDEYLITLGKKNILIVIEIFLFVLIISMVLYFNEQGDCVIGNFFLIKTEVTNILSLFLLFLSIIYYILLRDFLRRDNIVSFEYSILIMICTWSLCLLLSVNNFLTLYLLIELQSLCFYILVSFRQNSDYSLEAGLKYFILGSIFSSLLVFGISLFYGFTGLLNFTDIFYFFMDYSEINFSYCLISLSVFFIFSGLLFKIGSAPFHMWLIDVYSGSCISLLSFISLFPKLVFFWVLIKFYYVYFNNIVIEWNYIFIYCSLFSILIGIFGALNQKGIKRLLAYSAVVHVGYMLIGLVSNSINGVYGLLLYLFIYLILMINIFAILLGLRNYSDNKMINNLGSLNNLYKSNQIVGLSFILVLFSIGGIPPLIGFFSKLYIFFSLVKEGYYLYLFFIVILSVIGLVYYLRLIRMICMTRNSREVLFAGFDLGTSVIIVYTTLFGLVFFIYSNIFLVYIYNMNLIIFF